MDDPLDLGGFSWEDKVSFYTGCSFTFEEALESVGVKVRNIMEKKNVSMFKTSLRLYKVGAFDCEMIVTMRPVRSDLLVKAVAITAKFPDAHGAPVHIGNPARIGITDLSKPDHGNTVEVKEGEVPVFWACGVSNKEAIESASMWCVHESAVCASVVHKVIIYRLKAHLIVHPPPPPPPKVIDILALYPCSSCPDFISQPWRKISTAARCNLHDYEIKSGQ